MSAFVKRAIMEIEPNDADHTFSGAKVIPLHKPDQEYKVQLSLNTLGKNRLSSLQRRVDAASATQVIREALRLYDVLTEEIGSDKEFLTRDKKTGELTKVKLF